ncbi:hypothetical protein J2Y45_006346 [Dyadobacter sp. BE34]|uniref:Uncharacterized protein n=1 Tax=Dyadobacter fermentans TaxID=94254 RepID=A0ABU1R7E1_9BACT|nr:hypothetical protein [Dyadobacter fermentans]MDR7046875.1 hypothetical protein [Dyadobacter sp. BE242]MDR7201189.1 hypothetical protein [Dyadobacter sp. BE34]MDR7219149.1 hypothetical protein [Dyadobacter sp. BE31]MDR7264641.1 hypothetical protein [Dyadobacter sp. BE32]
MKMSVNVLNCGTLILYNLFKSQDVPAQEIFMP